MTHGLNAETIGLLEQTIRNDISAGDYDGARIIVARHGEIALDATLGWADRAAGRAMEPDSIFRVLSLTKAFTNALVYQAIGEGRLALSTRVVDIIPEFYGSDRFRAGRKDRVNLAHLMTHRSGMPATPEPLPNAQLGNLKDVIAAICELDVVHEPGTNLTYSPAVNHALMGEMLRRVYGADSFRDLANKNLFGPLGLKDTRFGPLADWKDRMVPLKAYIPDSGWLSAKDIEVLDEVINEDAEMPWVGSASSAADVFTFAEMIRRNGAHEGRQLIAPAVLDAATTLQTGDMTNDLYAMIARMRGWEEPPGNFGLGFSLSGTGTHPSFFGPFTSPRTHGNYGAGSTLFWIDPERDMTFVCLTAGVMDEGDNVLRFQKLSTIAASAVL
ncbi:CubicO group peptidase (beta-lactamase class C family) [Arthrobacter ginsengisoli]|uniref:CubicO group peptidase (Beta-lactamase class C family) n=1 Tax=Arthrobacter ginsengisoli TaxID=1356565 RepID=A0ABU1UGK0_9MICC|nr:serine hydrolase domain-containing protein [Arthrobacter ginsengisoli]MDR7084266.1 CubicO group peptidase (beta-lactamase class C family) [Arthrobacter ginsengisoli]